MEHDCMRDGCRYDGSLFCIYCGLTAEDIADTHTCACDHCREAGTCLGCNSGMCP